MTDKTVQFKPRSYRIYATTECRIADFTVYSGASLSHSWRNGPNETFTVEMVQGCLKDSIPTGDLQNVHIGICVAQRRVCTLTADLITCDPAVQSQIDELHSMLSHIMKVEFSETSPPERTRRLAQAMRRLGWSPAKKDFRVLESFTVDQTDGLTIEVDVGSVSRTFPLRIVVRGTQRQSVV